MFKVICIKPYGTDKIGDICKATQSDDNPRYYRLPDSRVGAKEFYLRLPWEPKTCAMMTTEEYLAMVCLRFIDETAIKTVRSDNSTAKVVGVLMPSKMNENLKYRITNKKSARELEMERIETEMHKLADSLEELRTKEN